MKNMTSALAVCVAMVAFFLISDSSPAQENGDGHRAASRARAERCAQGTYYNRETGGAQTFWSLSARLAMYAATDSGAKPITNPGRQS